MLNFFDMIADFFSFLLQFILNIISGTINAIQIVSSALSVPFQLTGLVSGIIGASIFLVVGLGVVKLLLGWGNS